MSELFSILLVRHFRHPINELPIECFLNRDVGHGCGWRGAVPMFFARRKPDDVAGANFFDGTAFALGPTEAGDDDQRLAEWMGVPGGPGARLEGDAGSSGAGRRAWLEEWIDANCAREPISRAFCRRL